MGIILWIVIGLVAGWIAHALLGSRGGIFASLAVGLIGAMVGGWLFGVLGIVPQPGFGPQLVSATVGAVVFLFVWRAIRRA